MYTRSSSASSREAKNMSQSQLPRYKKKKAAGSALSSSPLPVARPWTPPDVELESDRSAAWMHGDVADSPIEDQADSGYFGGSCDGAQTLSDETKTQRFLPESPSSEILPRTLSSSYHSGDDSSLQSPYLEQRPFTPTPKHGSHAPQYPYTPDSARMSTQRANTYPATSPTSWDSSPPLGPTITSPVQNALFSCLNNLEQLIQANQPEEPQMEYIIKQFEAIASFLSAPESQSRQSDDHLFSELDTLVEGEKLAAFTKEEAESYIEEVGKFVKGVQQHVKALEQRFDEVKQVNEVNLEVIANLRMRLRKYEEERNRPKIVHRIIKEEEKPGSVFWTAVTEALDQLGSILYDD